MEEYTNRQLGEMIKDGFKGIHKRQDTTNGQVAKHAEKISKLQQWRTFIMGGLAVVVAILLPIVLFILLNWLN